MNKFKILTDKNPVLRRKSKKINTITDEEKKIFQIMLDLMYESKGVGLAAPQIGVLKQMFVIDVGDGPLKLANPRIIKKEGEWLMEEGCLSLPGIVVKIKRAKHLIIEALDESGKLIVIETNDFLARVLMHEMDHLNGVLIIDYLPWPKRVLTNIKLTGKTS